MSDLRHPNIAMFLGLCFFPNCQLPVLLMERLDGSLDDLLETVPNIPLVLKLSILEDVAKGLLYLHKHTPQIIHRDLTAKNVVLTASLVAKVTDFGNSRIVNLQPGQLARTLSRLPGTLVYMPPEALLVSAQYGPSLDVFSFGHLALFTLIQVDKAQISLNVGVWIICKIISSHLIHMHNTIFLKVFPGNLLEPNYPDPHNPRKLVGRSEIERRGEYFDQLERKLSDSAGYPLVKTVQECLDNIPSERPTFDEILAALEDVRKSLDGSYGAVTKIDAVKQVVTLKCLTTREGVLREKEREIQRLQALMEQTQVGLCSLIILT